MSYIGNKPAQATIPADDSVTTAMLKDDAVTADKVANAINTDIAANTAKVTNATHTGDVTGATALTIASGAVDLAMLSATGTASSSTFLRGDNSWAAAGGGKLAQLLTVTDSTTQTLATTTYTDTGLSLAITPAATTSKIFCMWNMEAALGDDEGFGVKLLRDATAIYTSADLTDVANYYGWTYAGGVTHPSDWSQLNITQSTNQRGYWTYLDSPSTTSAITYKVQVASLSSKSIILNSANNQTQLVLMEISA